MDEIAIFDYALSEEQVQAQFDSSMGASGAYEAAVLADNPTGYWRLNETSGNTAANLGTRGSVFDGTYNAGEQGVAGPDAPGLGPSNVAYQVGPDDSFMTVDASPLNNLTEFTFSGWVQAQWPSMNLADTQLLVESVVRLSLSHIVMSTKPTELAARDLARLACRCAGFPDPS